jgi:hypothetical protein
MIRHGDRLRDLREQLDLADHDLERAQAEAEALLARLFALLDAGDIRAALKLIDRRLGMRGRA